MKVLFKLLSQAFFLTKTPIFFWIVHTSPFFFLLLFFSLFFLVIFGPYGFFSNKWRQISGGKKISPNMSAIWRKFRFQLHKDLLLELTVKPSSCSEHISSEAIGIWLRIHYTYLGKDWCTGYRALLSFLKCYTWGANLRVMLKVEKKNFLSLLYITL